LIIPDEVLRAAGMNEQEALLEIACRLFEVGRLTLWKAAKLADVTRVEFERELLQRRIPLYRPTVDDLKGEMAALDRLGV
jgi:predicted HTH domain antitoxin